MRLSHGKKKSIYEWQSPSPSEVKIKFFFWQLINAKRLFFFKYIFQVKAWTSPMIMFFFSILKRSSSLRSERETNTWFHLIGEKGRDLAKKKKKYCVFEKMITVSCKKIVSFVSIISPPQCNGEIKILYQVYYFFFVCQQPSGKICARNDFSFLFTGI